MKHFGLTLTLLVLLSFALPVFADSVTITLTGVGPGYNSAGIYTYPYVFSADSATNVPLMCNSFYNDIGFGESWQAILHPITEAGTVGLWASQGLSFETSNGQLVYNSQAAYDAEGLLYLGGLGLGPMAGATVSGGQALSNLSNGLANYAVWNVFSPGLTGFNSPYTQAQLNTLELQALGDVGTGTGLNLLSGIYVYSPVVGTQPSGDDIPQELVGGVPAGVDPVDAPADAPQVSATPEPSSWLLMGTGLMGMAGAARRRFLKALASPPERL